MLAKTFLTPLNIAACMAWSDRIILEIEARTSTALVGSNITAATLPRNATIGLNIGNFGWETNFPRARGINHIVQLVHRPADQMSFVSKSIGPDDKGGVCLTPLAAWLRDCHRFIAIGKAGRSTRSPWPTAALARAC